MTFDLETTRRDFIKTTAQTAGGFVIAFYLTPGMGGFGRQAAAAEAAQKSFAEKYPPNAFIRIAPDNSVVFTINKFEMGQGVFTSMAQLIAEELDCDWSKVRSVGAGVSPVYNHTVMPFQLTGGSGSLASTWEQYRRIGATMRAMLVQAAAEKWNAPVIECRTESGFVIHPAHGKLPYGEVGEAASKLPVPREVALKKPQDFKLIGKSLQRVDAVEKSTGTATFGMDVRIPGMVYACAARSPVHGGKLLSVDDAATRAIPGVSDVVRYGDSVAVLARNTYAARQGRDALVLKWDFHGKDNFSDASTMADFKQEADTAGPMVEKRGDAEAALKSAPEKFVAEYEFPWLAHAPMEPLNCTVNYDGKTCEIWGGHQGPTWDRDTAAKVLGLSPDKITLHVTYGGGSFGRRGSKVSDWTAEACSLAKVLKKPFKLVWTREDDMKGGFYRPMNFHRVEVGYRPGQGISGWKHRVIGQTVVGDSVLEAMMVKNGVERTVTEGVSDTPYAIADFYVDMKRPTPNLTSLWWRSVGHTHTAYVMETMIDDVAHRLHKDPVAYRKELLAKSPRHLAVIALLEKHSPIGQPAKKGHAYGIAVHESFNSVVGEVVEVSVHQGVPKVHRVWAAVHCGTVINPEGAKAQIEGGVVYGLSAALSGEIKVEKGEVVTANFDTYPVLRMNEMPVVEVFFVDSQDPPTGLGEPGVPPLAPAVANAIFKLTGKRVRRLPFSQGLKV